MFRDATPADAGALFGLTHAAFFEFAGDVPPPSALFESEAEVREELESGASALLAERGGKLAGAVRYRVERGVLHFFRLAVSPSFRRQGIAGALLAALEERAKEGGCTKISCHVRTQVTRNVEMYEHRGYALVGLDIQVRGGFAIRVGVMEKDLSPTPLPDVRSSLGKGQIHPLTPSFPKELATDRERRVGEERLRPARIVKGQRVTEEKVILAREFRQNPTKPEELLWERLRGNRLNGLKFRRQQIVAGFIVDFYCHAAALAVELDGSVHDDPGRDAERDAVIAGHGIETLRLPNKTVLHEIENALSIIEEQVQQRMKPLSQ